MTKYTSIEICAGAGGQALGLENAGFEHLALVEIDNNACNTLKQNRPDWNVLNQDLRSFKAKAYRGIDLLAGGVPCPPFSVASKQLGDEDERNLFPEAIRLAEECFPRAILLENVKGLLSKKFTPYRESLINDFEELGYVGEWRLIYSSDHGVSQLRPRAIFIAFRQDIYKFFCWPEKSKNEPPTVGERLYDQMALNGWELVDEWKEKADKIAPTLVGGSKKHGGADLGPTRAKTAWAELGVNGKSLAETPPEKTFSGMPKLTLRMAARIQGFPDSWGFFGKKTSVYRQIGNAFPPPVSQALGINILSALKDYDNYLWQKNKARELEQNLEITSKAI